MQLKIKKIERKGERARKKAGLRHWVVISLVGSLFQLCAA